MLTISSKWWKLPLRVFNPHGSSKIPLSHSVRDFSFMEECIYKSRQTHLHLMSGFPLTRYLTPWTARRSNQSILNPEYSLDAEAEAPILWPPDAKNWLIGKDPDAGKDWRQEEKGTTEDEMVGLHHWLDGHEFEQALGVGDEQGGLMSCSPRGHKVSDTTEWLNWTETFDFDLEQFSNFSVPDLCYLQNGNNDTTYSHFNDEILNPRKVEYFA